MPIDWSKLDLYVVDYVKSDSAILMTLKADYIEESRQFTANIPVQDGKSPQWYFQRAFKQNKKSIRDWVKDVSSKPSIIGAHMSFSEQDFNDDKPEPVVPPI